VVSGFGAFGKRALGVGTFGTIAGMVSHEARRAGEPFAFDEVRMRE